MQNQLVVLDKNGTTVTSTVTIAEGAEVEHRAVLQLVRTYSDDLKEFGPLAFEMLVVERDNLGGKQGEYALLNEQQATLILTYMRNSEIVRSFKKALVKAFWELAHRAPALPSIKELAMMVIKSEEAREEAERKTLALQKQNEVLKPKAELHDKYAGITSAHCNLRDAAKQLNFNPQEFNQRSNEIKWIFKNGSGTWVPYQDKVDRGLLILKMVDTPFGATPQTFVTPKGMTVLASDLGNPKKKKFKQNHDDQIVPLFTDDDIIS
jgi:anti-repressor protein